MLSVYLLRHGETSYNADGNRYCGRTDIGLTLKGIKQAETVNGQLNGKHIDAVYSSPLSRARITAEIATDKQVITDDRIIEVDFGQWEGKTKEEFYKEDPQSWNDWAVNPGTAKAGRTGESGDEIVNRVDAFFTEMLEKHAGETIVVVGHNGINRLYMAHKLGMPLKNYRRIFQENSAITFFELDDKGEFTLKKLNA
ncbi:histidine phosphatase family protein [Mucilaginibacter boryungensis]|uniref:Histidine phosphatase family protein n=1 Tax=Mucilaginibacter boryungensis TaxID=768480 RepID=A0ABR9XG62_9SPHI|nr:histidine phosphatase family protein [Mucilaginibacter boryungensis]MBE9666185.1 histidine phosphatase family protein [Mucilaginibacter boryungensis]